METTKIIEPMSQEAQAAFYLVVTALVDYTREAQATLEDMPGVFCLLCHGVQSENLSDPEPVHEKDCPYELATRTLSAYDREGPGPESVRRRMKEATFAKGNKAPEFTVETIGGTQEDFEKHYGALKAFIDSQYPEVGSDG